MRTTPAWPPTWAVPALFASLIDFSKGLQRASRDMNTSVCMCMCNLYINRRIHMYIYIYMYIHADMHTYMHMCICICIYTYAYIYICMCISNTHAELDRGMLAWSSRAFARLALRAQAEPPKRPLSAYMLWRPGCNFPFCGLKGSICTFWHHDAHDDARPVCELLTSGQTQKLP